MLIPRVSLHLTGTNLFSILFNPNQHMHHVNESDQQYYYIKPPLSKTANAHILTVIVTIREKTGNAIAYGNQSIFTYRKVQGPPEKPRIFLVHPRQ